MLVEHCRSGRKYRTMPTVTPGTHGTDHHVTAGPAAATVEFARGAGA